MRVAKWLGRCSYDRKVMVSIRGPADAMSSLAKQFYFHPVHVTKQKWIILRRTNIAQVNFIFPSFEIDKYTSQVIRLMVSIDFLL